MVQIIIVVRFKYMLTTGTTHAARLDLSLCCDGTSAVPILNMQTGPQVGSQNHSHGLMHTRNTP